MKQFRFLAAGAATLTILVCAPVAFLAAATPAAAQGRPEDPGNSNKPDKADKQNGPNNSNKPPKLTWSPSRLTEAHIVEGATEEDDALLTAVFESSKPIEEISFRLSGSLRNYLSVFVCEDEDGPIVEETEDGIIAGEVCFALGELPEEAGKTIGGTVQVIADGKPAARPLSFSLKRPQDGDDSGDDELEENDDPLVDGNGNLPIGWSEERLTSDLFDDGMAFIELTANRDLSEVSLWPTPSLRECVDVQILVDEESGEPVPCEAAEGEDPAESPILSEGGRIESLPAGGCFVVKFTLPEGEDELTENCGGTVHLRGAPRTFPAVLGVGDQDEEEGEGVAPVAIVSAASFQETPVAPGQIVSIFGEDVGPEQLEVFELNEDGEIGEMLGDLMIFFDGYPGRLLSANAEQVNVIVPNRVRGDSAELLVVNGHRHSTLFPLALAPVAPSLFSLNGTGRGQAAVLNSDGSVNGDRNAARFGTTLTFFGTGMGATIPPLEDGAVADAALPLEADVQVLVGGVETMLLYAGSAPGMSASVSQINARIGANTPKGRQEVVVVVDGVASPTGIWVVVR